ncbi:MAG: phenylacetic acid degradation protein [Candidatus Raymondbacteria bacterium RifOxyA12_full_50_37]|uniref:Phenylacetic acid degradation protein n=1 Tax=Candidatus Raymondbacteria bacterium RIFOXYD12_FULL_49_13 TaxID=1817890 RepID=A0A1F7F5Q4_UNCRA|nr:MAG: phenylacetic acid degradation protein [Candidatus Raymondbacteria bacterium RifOxyA12_full_50_37]OGJ89231.1 MAG: phenylacetic acid degradation protein [Candidatus Raymondbacteria bacterium RIFOXYA2_FULL_49_16]OGJ96481.1 MAG: phenylacetic acid degradation protein [Candidatus Raymondbacteria bacterium RifOxyC12_full_50_8]OGJ97397.1 MAG: phenylacetic acid degradation protein [Candidatus Raymondbacteria bacterium RIFOXYC2_FULL_50_21]OGJ99870.1 MAG: phenylacetic acid degradation protein [Can
MEKILAYFKNDAFAAHNNIRLVEVAPGTATATMEITANHLNSLGTVQGGAIFTLADLAFAAASNAHGTVAVALNVSINFLKAVGVGTLYANATENSINPKVATYTVRVTNEKDELIATFEGLAYRKKDKAPFA